MKRIFITLLPLFILLTVVSAQNSGGTVNQQSQSYTPTYTDSVEEGETVVSYEVDNDSESDDSTVIHKDIKSRTIAEFNLDDLGDSLGYAATGITVAITALLLVFCTPILIVLLVLYFN